MRKCQALAVFVILSAILNGSMVRSGWTTTFEDDFAVCPPAGAAGRSAGGIDLSKWTFDIGTRDMSDPANPGPERWGNDEPQYYTDRCERATHVHSARIRVAGVGKEAASPRDFLELQSAADGGCVRSFMSAPVAVNCGVWCLHPTLDLDAVGAKASTLKASTIYKCVCTTHTSVRHKRSDDSCNGSASCAVMCCPKQSRHTR